MSTNRFDSKPGDHAPDDQIQTFLGHRYALWEQGEMARRFVRNEERKRKAHPEWKVEPMEFYLDFIRACCEVEIGTAQACRDFGISNCPPHPELA